MFGFPKKAKPEKEPKSKPIEISDLAELNRAMDGDDVYGEIKKEQLKIFDYDQFAPGDDGSAGGNYFGVEFNIQTTVARLKALYAREPWVFSAADRIARAAASVPLLITDSKSGDILENNPAYDFLNTANAFQDLITMRWVLYLDLILTGNAMRISDESYSSGLVVPIELVTINPRSNDTTMESITDIGPIASITISGFGQFANATQVPWQQVIHFKLPNPFNPFFGMSPFTAASRPILLDRYKAEFEMAYYHRGGRNNGVIETEQDISKVRLERLMRTFENTFTGKRNWWRQLFLPKGAKWVSTSSNMSEMQHLEGLRENRLTLLAVLGIPPSQVGIVQDVNRSTSEVQQEIMWQNTIVPFLNFVAAGYNNSYVFKNVYKNKVKVVPDFSAIEAINGSIASKGEKAKTVEDYLTLNEIRTDILGYDALPDDDPRGNMLVLEIRRQINIPGLSDTSPKEMKAIVTGNTDDGTGTYRHVHSAQWDPQTGDGMTIDTLGDGPKHSHEISDFKVMKAGADSHEHAPLKVGDDTYKAINSKIKAQVEAAQSRLETRGVAAYISKFMLYRDMLTDAAKRSLENGGDPYAEMRRSYLERQEFYKKEVIPITLNAQSQGFDMAMATTKKLSNARAKANGDGSKFTPIDEQAIEAIRQRTDDDKRRTLENREIESFVGFDESESERVMTIIEDGLKEGKTTADIAKTISTDYDEAYRDQAFTIARTEILAAISDGLKWNHDVLNEVFTEVGKQWFHIGDVGINPDARIEHAMFESAGENGVVTSDHVWVNTTTGGRLQYPRDPSAPAADFINCRCSMVSVVGKTSTSNAEIFI